jgi:hypothetical protein
MVLTEQVLLVDVPFGAVRRGPLAGAPALGQYEAVIPIDHVDIRLEEFLLSDMVLIDICDLEPIHVLQRAGGLGRT